MAKQEGWRARSAFKLKQIDDMFNVFEGVFRVVDLCAAPGSWSQVVSKELYLKDQTEQQRSQIKIVAVDLQPMAPLPGVIQLQGDITEESTAVKIISYFDGAKANLVICDGAPDVTGLHAFDEYLQSQLVFSAFNITSYVLQTGGTFISKIFRAKNVTLLYAQMKMFFREVYCAKPRSSRQSSCEAFIVCKGYNPPADYKPSLANPVLAENYDEAVNQMHGINRTLVPFMACGDLAGFSRCDQLDSDRTYPLDMSSISEDFKEWTYTYQPPTQPPTDPAYTKACHLKKTDQLAKCEGNSLPSSNPSKEGKKKSKEVVQKNLCEQEKDTPQVIADFVDEIGKLFLED